MIPSRQSRCRWLKTIRYLDCSCRVWLWVITKMRNPALRLSESLSLSLAVIDLLEPFHCHWLTVTLRTIIRRLQWVGCRFSQSVPATEFTRCLAGFIQVDYHIKSSLLFRQSVVTSPAGCLIADSAFSLDCIQPSGHTVPAARWYPLHAGTRCPLVSSARWLADVSVLTYSPLSPISYWTPPAGYKPASSNHWAVQPITDELVICHAYDSDPREMGVWGWGRLWGGQDKLNTQWLASDGYREV